MVTIALLVSQVILENSATSVCLVISISVFLLFSSYFVTYYWVDCDAPSTCHGQGVCNTTTGSCECQGNFVGKDCYMCMPPHYGPSCDICTLLSSSLFLFVFFNIVL